MRNEFGSKFSSFWSGFFLGVVVSGVTGILFGTKKGREYLRKMIDLAENIEEDWFKFLNEEEKNEKRDLNEKRSVPAIIGKIKNHLTF